MRAQGPGEPPRAGAETPGKPGLGNGRAGFVLPVVLWVLALMAVLSASFAFKARTEARITRLGLERDLDAWAARAGAHRAAAVVREHAGDRTHAVTQAWFSDPGLYRDVPFGGRSYSVTRRLPDLDLGLSARDEGFGLDDEEGRLNVNAATPEMLMAWPGVSNVLAEAVVFHVAKAREREDRKKAGQAKSPDQVHPGVKMVDGPIRDLEELLRVPGMTRELLFGQEGKPGLAGDWTCFSSGKVNVNTARPRVLAALGLDEGRVNSALAPRRAGWAGFASVDEFLDAVGARDMKHPPPAGMLDVKSRNFRIECRAGRESGPGGAVVQARLTLDDKRMRFSAWRVRPAGTGQQE